MRASVVFNRRISPAYLHLGLAAPGFPAAFRAGEFVMVRPPWSGDLFLPRAFSIYRLSGPTVARGSSAGDSPPVVEILYKVLGKGTQSVARMEPGQAVEILGPLGNAFSPPGDGTQAVLVAGGIGVPPIAALAAQMAVSREPRAESRVEVFLGGRTSEDILCVKDFEEARARVHITTEDGSLDSPGLVTDLLRPFLLAPHASPLTMYTCGPPAMLAAVARLAEESGIPCQVSVEANMACGFGACMGCAIEVKGDAKGYRLVCQDGPVFDSREIVWR